jgi:hypothetical protein
MPYWNPLQPPEDGLPPDQVRFIEVRIEPWPDDGRKVRVHLQITPFLERPNIEVTIKDPQEEEVASIYIVETIEDRMVFTMHLRSPEMIHGKYTLSASMSYQEVGTVAQESVVFEAPLDVSE